VRPPLSVHPQAMVEELRLARHAFQRQYHETWLLGQHRYKTPAQVSHEQQCALAEAASF
jgi:hypothetical protein